MKTISRPLGIALAFLALLGFAGVITVNALANALPLNGYNTGLLSDMIPNLFVPAGLTFSIWGLIYLLLTILVGTLVFRAFSSKSQSGAWEGLDTAVLIFNFLANIGWIFAWHWRFLPLSMILMLAILGSLIVLSERIHRRLSPGGALRSAGAFQRFALSTPIHVYLGWISVATIANVTALLVDTFNWTSYGTAAQVWTVAVIAAGLAVALGMVYLRRMVAAPLVVVWAYAGIVLKSLSQRPDQADTAVWIAALSAAVLISLALAFSIPKRLAETRA